MSSGVEEIKAQDMDMSKSHVLFGECGAVAGELSICAPTKFIGTCAYKEDEEVSTSRHNLDFDIPIVRFSVIPNSWTKLFPHQ